MRRTGEDQSILLSGITGSGKSFSRQHLVNQLTLLSTHSKREAKIAQQIQNAAIIVESFGHARTVQNSHASKLGMFQELQFSERGRIIGAKTVVYSFDKSRLTSTPINERTYNVFYALLAGTTVDEKNALHINFPLDHFHYLSHHPINAKLSTSVQNQHADEIAFSDLKSALKICGFKAKTVTQIFQLLAAILHLGNIQFVDNCESDSAEEACNIKNIKVLESTSAMLGVSPSKLETALTYKLRLIRQEFCTAFLNQQGASHQRDLLAQALYHALILWIIESINTRLCYNEAEPSNFIGILDQFGFQNFKCNGFETFAINFANERLHHFMVHHTFFVDEGMTAVMVRDGVPVPQVMTLDGQGCMDLLVGKDKHGGLVALMDRDCAQYQNGATDATDANLLANIQRQFGQHPSLIKTTQTYSFGINHFSGHVQYTVDGFIEKNLDALSPDFVTLLRESSSNAFVSNLFQSSAMATESHPKDQRTIVKAQLSSKSTRHPSTRRSTQRRGGAYLASPSPSAAEFDSSGEQCLPAVSTIMDQMIMSMNDLCKTLKDTRVYNIIHIRPNDMQTADMFDAKRVRAQVHAYLLPDLAVRCSQEYANYYSFESFLHRYTDLVKSLKIDQYSKSSEREIVESVCAVMNWTEMQAYVGKEMVWLSYEIWKELEDNLRNAEKEERARMKDQNRQLQQSQQPQQHQHQQHQQHQHQRQQLLPDFAYNEYYQSMAQLSGGDAAKARMAEASFFEDGASYSESEYCGRREAEGSQWGEESEWGMKGLSEGFGPNMDMSRMIEDYHAVQNEQVEEIPITAVRAWWVRFVWFMTWWIPSPFLRWFGKMKRQDVQLAWREKVTLCILIFIFSAMVIFVIVGLSPLLCPGTKEMYSIANVQAHNLENDMYVSHRGVVYDMNDFAHTGHGTTSFPATLDVLVPLAGMDVSYTIPAPLTEACAGLVSSPTVKISPNASITLGTFIHYSGDQLQYPQLTHMADSRWYWDRFLPAMNMYKKGKLVISMNTIWEDYTSWGRNILSINKKVYDLTDYFATAKTYESGSTAGDYAFLDPNIQELFRKFSGSDRTAEWNKFVAAVPPEQAEQNLNCLNNAFYIGDVDEREKLRCTFSNYLLLAFAMIMCFVILVKFLAALQFGGAPTPEEHDKFVICQVPCYTEGEESLKKTIDSLTVMNYNDKRKLLFIISDGMVMGGGNDRPTPRIVLDVLGYDTKNDPEPLMFKSIGEGSKQLNYGKVYSGLYECEGHVVPYIVVVKVGKASERAKPGNRGKRDSQLICMNFLNKVHFDGEMTPLELEMYHQIKNVIGVNPSFYEYILMVDSDTEVDTNALNHLISTMLHDGRIIGLCGETQLVNEDRSLTTMIQVYEYYISHHLAKAFESLFGSVTCLPGCFCMYRIRTPVKNEPLIVSPKVIVDYSDNNVDTLHKKNLLHLGEDRYLTTLMMKHFPQYKMKFTPHAQCKTVAPDRWKVLISQRRRWINSTIHNLFELILLPDLCGFCCFSMRFVVLIDLIGTLTLPVSVLYLAYLLYVCADGKDPIPILALCMLAGLYGLQAMLFILKRQWQHIGWMIFYILAIPIFSLMLPVYSFWHFDDFSWGNTRIVVGDKKQKKIIMNDDEKFDEKMIPLKKWSVYEQELWETGSTGSRETGNTYRTYGDDGRSGNNSIVTMIYDGRSMYAGSQTGIELMPDYGVRRPTRMQTHV
ncbi:chitin synthase [Dichotomocladium elegans]|nr:chitin synthase [Dichotomocladium elegans]